MGKKFIFDSKTRESLEKIARLVFPMGVDAMLPIEEVFGKRALVNIVLPHECGSQEMYRYADNLKYVMSCLKSNHYEDFQIEMFRERHKQAKRLFQEYKACQRRRKFGECEAESAGDEACSQTDCNTRGQPIIEHMYEWLPKVPTVAWHCHATSKYGDIHSLSVPSGEDTLLLSRRIYLNGLPIEAEAITCTSETGEQATRLFRAPSKANLLNSKERVEIELN